MPQHFLLSPAARSLSIAQVAQMTDEEAEAVFVQIRWPDGKPKCPKCGCEICYPCRRKKGTAVRYRCKACRKDFSITAGTLLAHHKRPIRFYLLAIVIFCNEVKGKSALALSRDLTCHYRTAFLLAHKLREAMALEMHGRRVGGNGKEVEIDGAYFGGYIKPANLKVNRRDRRKVYNGKRRCVVIARQRDGHILPAVFKSEKEALGFIRRRVIKGTKVFTDDSGAWSDLQASFAVQQINHQEAYSLAGACTNWAESFFSRIRRGEIGHHHHIAGPYLGRYAQESAWREYHRKEGNGSQAGAVVALLLSAKPSIDFSDYGRRHRAPTNVGPPWRTPG